MTVWTPRKNGHKSQIKCQETRLANFLDMLGDFWGWDGVQNGIFRTLTCTFGVSGFWGSVGGSGDRETCPEEARGQGKSKHSGEDTPTVRGADVNESAPSSSRKKKPWESHEKTTKKPRKRPNTVFQADEKATKKPRKSHEKVTSKNVTSNEKFSDSCRVEVATPFWNCVHGFAGDPGMDFAVDSSGVILSFVQESEAFRWPQPPVFFQKYCRTNGRRTAVQMGGVLQVFPFFEA